MSAERLDERLARLERERQEADRQYQDALTALDRAVEGPGAALPPPPAFDERQITPINEAWDILPAGALAVDRSLKGRLRAFIWRLVGPPLTQQKHFNAALVDHLNRNVAPHRDTEQVIALMAALVQDHTRGVAAREQRLIEFLQTITLYVDTKDRAVAGQALVVNEAVSALADEWLKRWESRTLRDLRGAAEGARADSNVEGVPSGRSTGFEAYAPIFDEASDVVEIGCGRGDLLNLLRARGVTARGIDIDDQRVGECRARGLQAERADALSYLAAQPDASIGGLAALHVVEHLDPPDLMKMLGLAARTLRPGATMVIETAVRPIHPDTLQHFVQASGFSRSEIRFTSPVPDDQKLEARLFPYMDYAIVAVR